MLAQAMDLPAEALAACDRALQLDPLLTDAWRQKYDLLCADGRPDEAEALVEQWQAYVDCSGSWDEERAS